MAIDESSNFFKDFRVGDLVYGTQIDRDRYFPLAAKKSTAYTIDEITRELDVKLKGWGNFATKQLTQGEFDQLPQPAQAFLCYAQRTTLWGKMRGRNTSDYTKLGVAKARIGLGDRLQWSEAYFRAKCKAGIGFVIDSGYHIRFVLDSLYRESAMEAVARKESNQPWHTGSELRYVYKHREMETTKNQVVFYVDGDRVPAPWVRFAQVWDQYGKTRMDDTHVPEVARK